MGSFDGLPGVEPRAWWSPTRGYFLLRWSRAAGSEQVDLYTVSWEAPHQAVDLPADAVEFGAAPTQWAYDRACEALHQHAQRADNYAGRLERLRLKVIEVLELRNVPVEVAVDLALNRALGRRPVAQPEMLTWDAAYTRLREVAGVRADEGEVSAWATVTRALTAAEGNAELHYEVCALAGRVNLELSEQERSPGWLAT